MRCNFWKRLGMTLVVGTLALPGACPAQEASAPDVATLLRLVQSELRTVHLELLEQRKDFEEIKLQGLQRELDSIQKQQREIGDEQASVSRQAADIEAQLGRPGLEKAEREELEARRAELAAVTPTHFTGSQNAFAAREASASDRLKLEEQTMQALQDRIRALSVDSHQ